MLTGNHKFAYWHRGHCGHKWKCHLTVLCLSSVTANLQFWICFSWDFFSWNTMMHIGVLCPLKLKYIWFVILCIGSLLVTGCAFHFFLFGKSVKWFGVKQICNFDVEVIYENVLWNIYNSSVVFDLWPSRFILKTFLSFVGFSCSLSWHGSHLEGGVDLAPSHLWFLSTRAPKI